MNRQGPDLDFVNRTSELASIGSLLSTDQGPRVKLWTARPATGVTSLLQHSSEVFRRKGIVCYVDCANRVANSAFAQVALQLYHNYQQHWHELESWTKARLGNSRTRSLTQAGLSGLPWVGPFLGAALEESIPSLEMSRFPSATAQLLCEFLLTYASEIPILVLLDNSQEIDDWSIDLLTSTMSGAYSNFRFVMAFVKRDKTPPGRLDDLIERTMITEGGLESTQLHPPSTDLAIEIATAMGVKLAPKAAEALLLASNNNIYRLLMAVRRLARSSESGLSGQRIDQRVKLTPLMREIVQLLETAGQSLRETDLMALCLKSETSLAEGEKAFLGQLTDLVESGLLTCQEIPDGDRLLQTTPAIADLGLSAGDIAKPTALNLAEKLYTYFENASASSLRHSKSELAPLLYRLSKQVAPGDTAVRIQDVLALTMGMGSISAAERLVGRATSLSGDASGTYTDYVLKSAFLLSSRRHSDALVLLSSPPNRQWKERHMTRLMKSIALNRCRKHRQSEEAIVRLLAEARLPEEIALLASYRVAGLLHTNRVETARSVFHKYALAAKEAENFGYFLRNAADAFDEATGAEMLKEAALILTKREDRFGAATCLSNRASKLVSIGRIQDSVSLAQEAHQILEVFGIHHLHIVTNNLGICHLMVGDCDRARQLLETSLRIARTEMPVLFTQINLAAALAASGRPGEAARLIEDIADDVKHHPVDRVRQKYYVNAAAIARVAELPKGKIRSLCDQALSFPDRFDENITQERVKLILAGQPASSQEFLQMYYPCHLLYWYQNPLEGLPEKILTSEAMSEDSSN